MGRIFSQARIRIINELRCSDSDPSLCMVALLAEFLASRWRRRLGLLISDKYELISCYQTYCASSKSNPIPMNMDVVVLLGKVPPLSKCFFSSSAKSFLT